MVEGWESWEKCYFTHLELLKSSISVGRAFCNLNQVIEKSGSAAEIGKSAAGRCIAIQAVFRVLRPP